ncbi:hypothetical protein [Paraburkholderia dinghuensis]|uniref:UDP-glucose 4-epimerase n=1 Tax=Paraburkholderia dinghuensis TaxID=2305225 RepID=A0A3N6MQ42_9BURK|nr:hypothetical protein [Paraburkholderia dinghuensis]RQH05808.1 hypothetical protein D1Y85_14455 [Paraburkholderia dinghuensis]
MSLNGTISGAAWTVIAETVPAPQGGFGCRIHVSYAPPEAQFTREFTHHSTFENETTAILEGLREGVLWVELKTRRAFHM